jgi:hypothetical protein
MRICIATRVIVMSGETSSLNEMIGSEAVSVTSSIVVKCTSGPHLETHGNEKDERQ